MGRPWLIPIVYPPYRLRPILYPAAIGDDKRAREERCARTPRALYRGGGRARYKLEQRLLSSLSGLVESAESPPVTRARGPGSPVSPRAVRRFFSRYLEFFARSTILAARMNYRPRRSSPFAMLVLVLVVQVITTIVPTAAVGPLSRSLNFDDVRPEEDDNAVVVEGWFRLSNVISYAFLDADPSRSSAFVSDIPRCFDNFNRELRQESCGSIS